MLKQYIFLEDYENCDYVKTEECTIAVEESVSRTIIRRKRNTFIYTLCKAET